MDTKRQQVLWGKNEMQVMKKDDQLYFETVLIPETEFEVVYPEPVSPSETRSFENFDKYNNPASNEFSKTDIRDAFDGFKVFPHDLSAIGIQEEGDTVEHLLPSSSTIKLNGDTNKNKDCVRKTEKPFRLSEAQSDHIFINKVSQDLDTSLGMHQLINSGSRSHLNDVPLPKTIKKLSKLQQKEKFLIKALARVDTEISSMKKLLTYSPCSVKVKNQLHGTVFNSSALKNEEDSQKKIYSSKLKRQMIKRAYLKDTLNNLHHSNESKECDIDFLKKCIIEASRTLIKTEKSLKVLGKFLHSDVMVEKQAANKHLKDFHHTVNNFRKTMNGIDKRLLTSYKHLVPNISSSEESSENSSKDNLGSLKCKDDIRDNLSLLNKHKEELYINQCYEIISPVVPTKKVNECSSVKDDTLPYLSPVNDETEPKKIRKRKSNKNCPIPKKDKNNGEIVYRNRRKHLESDEIGQQKFRKGKGSNDCACPKNVKFNIVYGKEKKHLESKVRSRTQQIQSKGGTPSRNYTSNPIIILD